MLPSRATAAALDAPTEIGAAEAAVIMSALAAVAKVMARAFMAVLQIVIVSVT
jgi:hypothetical protein